MKYIAILFVLTGCGGGWQAPAATVNSILAATLCAQARSESAGISWEDAKKAYCSTTDQLNEWLTKVEEDPEAAVAAVEARGESAGAARCEAK